MCRDPGICDDNPCVNGGVCYAGIGKYTCNCPMGFLGYNCEMDCQARKDIVLMLDSSSSVGEVNFEIMKKFMASLVKDMTSIGVDHNFALVTYNSKVDLIFSLNRYRQMTQIEDAILTTRYKPGGSNIADAVRTAAEVFSPSLGDRSGAENIAILFTTGTSTVNSEDTLASAEDLKYGGAKFVSVGIGMSDPSEITQMSSSQNDVFQVINADALEEIKAEIMRSSCTMNDHTGGGGGELEGSRV